MTINGYEINELRAMCAELAEALHEHTCLYEGHESELVTRARALLAQPEPQPPAAGEVAELQRWGVDHGAQPGRPLLCPMDDGYWTPWHIAADLLQRQHPQPVAVSERPWEREGWCDADGKCWLETVKLIPDHAVWIKTWPAWVEKFPQCYVRALPANALPTPEALP